MKKKCKINQLSVFWWKSKRNKKIIICPYSLNSRSHFFQHTHEMNESKLTVDSIYWSATLAFHRKFIWKIHTARFSSPFPWARSIGRVLSFFTLCVYLMRESESERMYCLVDLFASVCESVSSDSDSISFPYPVAVCGAATKLRCDTETNIYVLPHKIGHPHASTTNPTYKHNYINNRPRKFYTYYMEWHTIEQG